MSRKRSPHVSINPYGPAFADGVDSDVRVGTTTADGADPASEPSPSDPESLHGKPRRRGRPTSYNAAVREKLLLALRGGNSRATAAEYAGISEPTLSRWLAKPQPHHLGLLSAVEGAEAAAKVTVVSNLFAKSKTSSRAAETWLRVHGGPEWRRRCPNCGTVLGNRDDSRKSDAPGSPAPARDEEQADTPPNRWPSTGDGLTWTQAERDILTQWKTDPTMASLLRRLSGVPPEWRWPIDRMLAAAALGRTPTAFFTKPHGVDPSLREDIPPMREWWDMPRPGD